MKIDEKMLDELEAEERRTKGGQFLATDTVLELIRLARIGLELQALKDQENGKANLMAVIKLGRWAKEHGLIALNSIEAQLDPPYDAENVHAAYAEVKDALAKLPKEDA